MEQTTLAWVAGYMDGDGCISMTRRSGRKYRSLIISFASIDLELLEHLKDLFGGFIISKPTYKNAHTQSYEWRLRGSIQILSFLNRIYPYIRCPRKKVRAQMIIQEWRKVTPRNGRYTPEVRALKRDFEERFLKVGGR